MKNIATLFVIALILSSCSTIIPSFTSKQKGKLCTKPECLEADQYFWENLHAGNYDSIPQILIRLKAVYLENSADWKIAAHIGFTHIWALTERDRLPVELPGVTDHAVLGRKYFEQAIELAPEKDWRFDGFYASLVMTEGGIHNDMNVSTRGFFLMKKAVKKYPEFNLFTSAYTLINSGQEKFKDLALEQLWETVDKCLGEKVDRDNLDYRKYMGQKEVESKMSTCWNTWIAPHNLEGFFMILGDLLVENNDLKRALNVYTNVTYFEEFEYWPYKEHLLDRIAQTEKVIERKMTFKEIDLKKYDGCMVCHQEKQLENTPYDVHVKRPKMDISLYLGK